MTVFKEKACQKNNMGATVFFLIKPRQVDYLNL